MGTTPEDLHALAEDLLSVIVEALDSIPTYAPALGGAPERSFVSPGVPVFDWVQPAFDGVGCCLVGDSMISTDRGPVRIEDVRVGDQVWSFDEGHLVLRRVLRNIPRGSQPVFRVRGRNRTVVGTATHPLLVLRPEHKRTHGGKPQVWNPEWVHIEDLNRGDALVSLSSFGDQGERGVLPDGTTLTREVAWLLGLWVGDGCFSQDSAISFSVFDGVRNRADEILRDTWKVRPKSKTERLDVYSKELCDVFLQIFKRVRAPEKRVPDIIWGREPEVIRGFLDGYGAADGYHEKKTGYMRYATASRHLAAETRMLHIGLGDSVSNLAVEERTKPIQIKGKLIKQALPLHRYSVYPGSLKTDSEVLDYRGARRALPDERFGICKVGEIVPLGEAETFDLEVEGTHNFIADGIVVHNCDQVTVHVEAITDAPTSPAGLAAGQKKVKINHVTLVATVTRCVPVSLDGLPPAVADLEESAAQINADGWAIWNHVFNLILAGEFLTLCTERFFDGMRAIRPSGGCGGFVFTFRAGLDGYEEP